MRIRFLTGVPLLLVALAVTTGCGGPAAGEGVATADGGTSTASPSTGATTPVADEDKPLRFAQCMREHGVDMPDPDPGGKPGLLKIDRNDPKFAKAFDACKQYAPIGDGTRTLSPEQQQQVLAFTKCMREHGIDVPDPQPDGGIKFDKKSGVDLSSPKFKAASEACERYLPQRSGSK